MCIVFGVLITAIVALALFQEAGWFGIPAAILAVGFYTLLLIQDHPNRQPRP